MLRRAAWVLAIAVLLTSCFLLAWAGLPSIRIWLVERDLNRVYALYRPIPYRWQGAPVGTRTSSAFVPVGEQTDTVKRAAATLSQIRRTFAADPRWFVLSARLALITGRLDDAILNYRRARLLNPASTDTETELAAAYAQRGATQQRGADYALALGARLRIANLEGYTGALRVARISGGTGGAGVESTRFAQRALSKANLTQNVAPSFVAAAMAASNNKGIN